MTPPRGVATWPGFEPVDASPISLTLLSPADDRCQKAYTPHREGNLTGGIFSGLAAPAAEWPPGVARVDARRFDGCRRKVSLLGDFFGGGAVVTTASSRQGPCGACAILANSPAFRASCRRALERFLIRLNPKCSPFSLILRMILSEKSATFRDHALGCGGGFRRHPDRAPVMRSRSLAAIWSEVCPCRGEKSVTYLPSGPIT
jgi:hypothetical protein